jgi:hypothetical protein
MIESDSESHNDAWRQSEILQGHRVLHLHGGPSPNLQRGHPVDILVHILHGSVESTPEEVNAISHRIVEFRAFLESLHPAPILSPIAQGQQLGVESQANAQAPRCMNYQGPQTAVDTEVLQNTRTVPGKNLLGCFDVHLRPPDPYSAGQYCTSMRWNFVSAVWAGLSIGTMPTTMAPSLIRKPVTLNNVALAVVHQTALRVLLRLTLLQMYQTKSFIGSTA